MKREFRKDVFEAIGLLAIVATLLFVAMELRQANLASRIAAREAATQGHLDIVGAAIDASVLATAYSKLDAGEELTGLESSQLGIHLWRRWKHYERVFYLYEDGVLLEREWEGFKESLLGSFSDPSDGGERIRQSWYENRSELSTSFVEYVESNADDAK